MPAHPWPASGALSRLGYEGAADGDGPVVVAVRDLAADAVVASYASEGATVAASAARSRAAADVVRQAVTAKATAWQRLRRAADPSGLWQAWLATARRAGGEQGSGADGAGRAA